MARLTRRPRRRHVIHYADLATYIAETGDPQVNIAARVQTSQANISRIAAGDLVPRPRLALRIAKYARIPLDSFVRVHLAKHADN